MENKFDKLRTAQTRYELRMRVLEELEGKYKATNDDISQALGAEIQMRIFKELREEIERERAEIFKILNLVTND